MLGTGSFGIRNPRPSLAKQDISTAGGDHSVVQLPHFASVGEDVEGDQIRIAEVRGFDVQSCV